MRTSHRIAIFVLAAALSSCAAVNEGLKDFNEGMSKVTGKPNEPTSQQTGAASRDGTPHDSTLAYKNGGTKTIAFKIPAKHCAPDEYVNEYERGYANRWNERVGGRQIKYIGSKAAADKTAYAELDGKNLIPPKALPMPSPEELRRRDRLSADCTDTDGSVYGEAQAYNDVLAEFPD